MSLMRVKPYDLFLPGGSVRRVFIRSINGIPCRTDLESFCRGQVEKIFIDGRSGWINHISNINGMAVNDAASYKFGVEMFGPVLVQKSYREPNFDPNCPKRICVPGFCDCNGSLWMRCENDCFLIR